MTSEKERLGSLILCVAMLLIFMQVAPQENASAGLNEEWARTYNGYKNGLDMSYRIIVDESSNVYVTGPSWGGGGCVGGVCGGPMHDFTTIKYDRFGVEQWARRWNGEGDAYDIPKDMTRDPTTGNIYVVGESTSEYGYFYDELDYAVVAYDSAGTELWVRTFEGTAEENDSAYAVTVDPSSGNGRR